MLARKEPSIARSRIKETEVQDLSCCVCHPTLIVSVTHVKSSARRGSTTSITVGSGVGEYEEGCCVWVGASEGWKVGAGEVDGSSDGAKDGIEVGKTVGESEGLRERTTAVIEFVSTVPPKSFWTLV